MMGTRGMPFWSNEIVEAALVVLARHESYTEACHADLERTLGCRIGAQALAGALRRRPDLLPMSKHFANRPKVPQAPAATYGREQPATPGHPLPRPPQPAPYSDKGHRAVQEYKHNWPKPSLEEAQRQAELAEPQESMPPQDINASDDEPEPETQRKPATQADPLARFRKLFDTVKRGPVEFLELCDTLDMGPSKLRALLDDAQSAGYHIEPLPGHQVGWRIPEPRRDVQDVAPVVGERQSVGVISDLHYGSKYCLRQVLSEFVHECYERGIRDILGPGDNLDGCYRHGVWELTHHGLDEQAEDMYENLPALPGLRYHCITGNHDETFAEKAGLDVGKFCEAFFKNRGRNDLTYYGNRGAFLRVKGAIVHLWHPRSGQSYARSYALQKQIEKYSSNQKPNILLAGHWHTYCHVYERGVEAFACPTFQGAGSSFGKSLGGAPSIGGLILSWGATEHGTLREFAIEARRYFERETLYTVDGFDEVRHGPA